MDGVLRLEILAKITDGLTEAGAELFNSQVRVIIGCSEDETSTKEWDVVSFTAHLDSACDTYLLRNQASDGSATYRHERALIIFTDAPVNLYLHQGSIADGSGSRPINIAPLPGADYGVFVLTGRNWEEISQYDTYEAYGEGGPQTIAIASDVASRIVVRSTLAAGESVVETSGSANIWGCLLLHNVAVGVTPGSGWILSP